MMGLIGGEPTIHYEYIIEAGRLCHERGSISKLHTSGYISEQIFTNITKAVDVIVISVKGSASKALYQRMGADRDVILRSIELAWETPRVDGSVRQAAGILIGNLIGPGLEPIKEETERFGSWIANKLDPYVQVMVEGMLGPVGNFTDLPPIILGDRDRYLRVQNVGEALFGAGLKNVWMQLPGLAATTFPVKRWMWPNGEKRFDDE
jgi:pyruvate-formate lyase-activating enzyme